MKIKKVALFGDSILKGVVLDDNNRYCFSKALDWERVENAFGVSIINKSRFGCEITKGQRIVNDFLLAGGGRDPPPCSNTAETTSTLPGATWLPARLPSTVPERGWWIFSKNCAPWFGSFNRRA